MSDNAVVAVWPIVFAAGGHVWKPFEFSIYRAVTPLPRGERKPIFWKRY